MYSSKFSISNRFSMSVTWNLLCILPCSVNLMFTIHRTAEEGEGCFFNSFLPLPPASLTLRHQPGNYCRELSSPQSQQLDSNREPLVPKCKSLTTKIHNLDVQQSWDKISKNLVFWYNFTYFFQNLGEQVPDRIVA